MSNTISQIQNIPFLGAGIGFRPDFRSDLFEQKEKTDFLEITADHYLNSNPFKAQELELLQKNFSLIPHAINLSLGSAEGLDMKYLDSLRRLIDKIEPQYWSEHIAFTKTDGIEIGHLSPVVFNEMMIDIFCENIETARKYIQVPLILENITYHLQVPGADMNETEFISKLLERADVGLLLDVTNLYTNSVNHQFDYKQFLAEIPLERVVQFHFVGGYWQNDVLIDGHSHQTPEEVWEVMRYVVERTPNLKGAILERDENIPNFTELSEELAKARTILNNVPKNSDSQLSASYGKSLH